MPYITYRADLKKIGKDSGSVLSEWAKAIWKAGPEPAKFLEACFKCGWKLNLLLWKGIYLTFKKFVSLIGLI